MIKTRGKLYFSIFWIFFAPLEEKMIKKTWKNVLKNEKKMTKNEKEND